MKKPSALAAMCALLASTPAYSMTCTSNPAQFDFMQTSAQVFYFGTEDKVRGIYEKLRQQVGDPRNHARTTLFFADDGLQRLSRSYCESHTCTGMDVIKGLQHCSAAGKEKPGTLCRPLAAIYEGNVYCLLAPGLDTYSNEKPFVNFNPYGDGGEW
ncbi:hypothetical protein [Xanthomonas sp. 3075]|uniref:hypothetical protein n=1 Tax=Xanthomonas sp. 3075 TaxID=3035315 RepID=UPI001618E0D2|nr:hypothetical protein [Xanthomonas sp. 3075]MBB4130155.1 hypothetical protein [Xanthomonas sp. 3075]